MAAAREGAGPRHSAGGSSCSAAFPVTDPLVVPARIKRGWKNDTFEGEVFHLILRNAGHAPAYDLRVSARHGNLAGTGVLDTVRETIGPIRPFC